MFSGEPPASALCDSALAGGSRLRLWSFQQLVQMQVKRPQVAAVVAGGDSPYAGPAGRPDACPHRRLHCRQIDAVNDHFIDGVHALGQRRWNDAAERGAVGIVSAGPEFLVAAADLAAAAD